MEKPHPNWTTEKWLVFYEENAKQWNGPVLAELMRWIRKEMNVPKSNLFDVHILNTRGINVAREIQSYFEDLLKQLEEVCPDGREMAIVRTKLQEAAFFAKRAMAMDSQNQK